MLGAIGDVYPLPRGVAGTLAVGGAEAVDLAQLSRVGKSIEATMRGGKVVLVDDPNFEPPTIPDPDWIPGEGETEEDRPDIADPDAVAPQVKRFLQIVKPSRLQITRTITPERWQEFIDWCKAPLGVDESGAPTGRGRTVDGDEIVERIDRDALVFILFMVYLPESDVEQP